MPSLSGSRADGSSQIPAVRGERNQRPVVPSQRVRPLIFVTRDALTTRPGSGPSCPSLSFLPHVHDELTSLRQPSVQQPNVRDARHRRRRQPHGRSRYVSLFCLPSSMLKADGRRSDIARVHPLLAVQARCRDQGEVPDGEAVGGVGSAQVKRALHHRITLPDRVLPPSFPSSPILHSHHLPPIHLPCPLRVLGPTARVTVWCMSCDCPLSVRIGALTPLVRVSECHSLSLPFNFHPILPSHSPPRLRLLTSRDISPPPSTLHNPQRRPQPRLRTR